VLELHAVRILIGLPGSVALAGSMPAAPFQTAASAFEREAHGAPDRQAESEAKPRVFILTDIGADPDDSESLVRFLLYSNEFDVEGMAAVTSTWMRDKIHPELIDERVKAFGAMRFRTTLPPESNGASRHRSNRPTTIRSWW
jgi:hypothetical protein